MEWTVLLIWFHGIEREISGTSTILLGSAYTTYAREIWKCSFKLLLQFGLPYTLICHQERIFENAFQTGEIWKHRLLVFVWTENILKTELFRNSQDILVISLTEVCPNTNLRPESYPRKPSPQSNLSSVYMWKMYRYPFFFEFPSVSRSRWILPS